MSRDAAPAHVVRRRYPMIASPARQELCANCTARNRRQQAFIGDNGRMCPVATSAPMACASGPLSAIDADLLIVPLFQGEGAGAVPDLDAATGGERTRAFPAKAFSGTPRELSLAAARAAKWRARRVMVVGGGGSEPGTDLLRRLAAA